MVKEVVSYILGETVGVEDKIEEHVEVLQLACAK